jgi:hypothetical protein
LGWLGEERLTGGVVSMAVCVGWGRAPVKGRRSGRDESLSGQRGAPGRGRGHRDGGQIEG